MSHRGAGLQLQCYLDPCCGSFSSQKATMIIAIVDIIFWSIALVLILIWTFLIKGTFGTSLSPYITYHSFLVFVFVLLMITAVTGIIFGILLYFGAKNREPYKVLAWIIAMFFMIFFMIISFGIGIEGIFIGLISIGIHAYFLFVVFVFFYEINGNRLFNVQSQSSASISLWSSTSRRV